MNLTLFKLLQIFSVPPDSVRLVRHTNKEITARENKELTALEVFRDNKDKFLEYTAWQLPNKFKDAKHLVVFSSARGTTALFLGIWRICGVTHNKELQPQHLDCLRRHKLPEEWFQSSVRYQIELTDLMASLSERLVIDWGKSARNWVQTQDKPIVQIKPLNSIGDFLSYDRVQLSYEDLQKLKSDSDSNESWVKALSSVNGVYLIKHKRDGRLYVGAAYGKDGILGRWFTYSLSGHAGNKKLIGLNPNEFEFSVLEICPNTMSETDVRDRESRWKKCLGTREFGLNDN